MLNISSSEYYRPSLFEVWPTDQKPQHYLGACQKCRISDPISDLLKTELAFNEILDNFFAYCGYNTSANTIGCAIFIGLVKYLASLKNQYSHDDFLKIQLIRLLDDWAYQAIVRKYIREQAPDFKRALFEKEMLYNFLKDETSISKKVCTFLDFSNTYLQFAVCIFSHNREGIHIVVLQGF